MTSQWSHIPSDQSHRVTFLPPSRVTPDLDTLRLDCGGQLRQIFGDGALGQRRRDQHPDNTFAVGVYQPVDDGWLHSINECLNCRIAAVSETSHFARSTGRDSYRGSECPGGCGHSH